MPKVSQGVATWWWYSYCYRNSDGGLSFDNDVCLRMHPITAIRKDKWKILVSFHPISETMFYEYKKSI